MMTLTPRAPRRLAGLAAVVAALTAALLAAGCATSDTAQNTTVVSAEENQGASLTTGGSQDQAQGQAQGQTQTQALPAALSTPQVLPASAITATLPPGESAAVVTRPLLPRQRLDPLADAQRSDLWLRVRKGLAMPDVDNELVRKWERFYAADPAYVQRMTERSSRYLFHIIEEVDKRGMPTELALLPFIESAFNPQAQSRASASGMWQFMPATGKDFELRQNLFRDDRRDVLASTRAALDYLQRLHGMFDDWHLALAAYNWGQGNVSKAIERNRRVGLPVDYESLKLPQETREYVPKLQAMKNIVLHPDTFALSLPALENHPFFLSVAIERDIDVALAAQLAGLSLDAFQQLNPQMNKPVILAAGTPQVLLPYDSANLFVQKLQLHRGAMATWTAWVAPRTLNPADAAKLVGISEAQLREANDIPPRMLVKAGSTLLVPRAPHLLDDVTEHVADHAALALAPDTPPLRQLTFKAGKKGDSVAGVARRYRVSAAQVAQWNGVGAKSSFKAGDAIVVMLPQKRAVPAASRVAAKSSKVSTPSTAAPRAVVKTVAKASTRTASKAGRGSVKPAAAQRVAKGGGKAAATRTAAAQAAPRLRIAEGPPQTAPR